MPRTAPTFTGTPTYMVVSFRFIDANGSKTSTPYLTTQARATAANVEAMAVALAAASNANLYDIVLETHTEGAASTATASEDARMSANDYVNTLVREPVNRKTQEVSIPAPVDAMLIEGTNNVDPTNSLYQAVNVAADAMLPADYVFVSARFTEYRKSNQKINF